MEGFLPLFCDQRQTEEFVILCNPSGEYRHEFHKEVGDVLIVNFV